MQRYECNNCRYVYDPVIGDQEAGVAPGTSFDNVSSDWACPECGGAKDGFELA
ncbi:rubredoxin [Streptomyces griseus]|uniref:rubredoxin n=1 Tax=Streptomyces TaxID=1883 RepID=UPI002FEFCF1B